MKCFGVDVVVSDAVPPGSAMMVPPWFGECKIIAGVAVRLRQSEERPDGKIYNTYSPLTEDELRHFAAINNLG